MCFIALSSVTTDSHKPSEFVFMPICECNLSHTSTSHTRSGLKGGTRLWENIISAGVGSDGLILAQMLVKRVLRWGLTENIICFGQGPATRYAQTHTHWLRHTHTRHLATNVTCFFFIRNQTLEAITRVILDFNGEIIDLEKGRREEGESEESKVD